MLFDVVKFCAHIHREIERLKNTLKMIKGILKYSIHMAQFKESKRYIRVYLKYSGSDKKKFCQRRKQCKNALGYNKENSKSIYQKRLQNSMIEESSSPKHSYKYHLRIAFSA